MGLIEFFVKRHLLVNVLAMTTIILAVFLAQDVPREFLPSIEMPRVIITAKLPGESARDMETKVTIPIQEAIQTVDGIDEYYTVISDSVSVTTVDLYIDSTDEQVDTAIQDLRDAIDGITDFPPEMEDRPVFKIFNPGKWSIVELAMAGPMEVLIPLAQDMEYDLQRLPSISRATIVGLQDPEVRVLVDPLKASSYGITVLEVVQAVQRRNVSATGAVLETPQDRKQVTVWSRYEDPTEVADTIVRASPELGVVQIGDIARVEKHREDTGLLTHTNGQPGLSVVVSKRENADALVAIEEIRSYLAGQPLPDDVTVNLVNDRTFYTSNRLGVMLSNGLIGGILVALVLYAFMRKEAALWVLVGIPIVFCGAIIMIPTLGMTFNMFTLTGFVIVLGMVVDDAVVVAENVVAHRERGLPAMQAATLGAYEMIRPVSAAALTTLLAFGPIVAMGGLPGKVMWQIPAAVCLVLIFSLLESFLVLPAHMSTIKLKDASGRREFVVRLERRYRKVLQFCFRRRLVVVLAAVAILVFIMAVIRPNVMFVQFPQDDARLLFVKITAPVGTALEQTEAISINLYEQIKVITERDLRAVTARIGHQDQLNQEKSRGEAENEALLTLVFEDLDRQHTNNEWIARLSEELVLPEGVKLNLQSEYTGPPTGRPVQVHVRSNDDDDRRRVAEEIRQFIAASEGTSELEIDERLGTPKLNLNLNYEKLAIIGLDPQDVALTVQASFFGLEASEHRDMVDTTELRIMFDPNARNNLDSFLDTPLRARDGSLVLLRDVVNPVATPGLDRIFHRDGYRTTTVSAGFTPDAPWTSLTYAAHMEASLFPQFDGYQGMQVYIGGEAQDTEEATGALGSVALLVVLAIAVVIWILLGSLAEALFVITVIPWAIAGVILAFFLHNQDLSMVSAVGVIGLSGVVVNASIVMLDAIHRHLRAPGNELLSTVERQEVVLNAIVSRLRPIVVTTLTTLGGVLPTAYGIGGYDMLISPMSLAIGWGLVFSTGMTLFVVPVFYSIAFDITTKVKSRSRVSAVAHELQ